MKTVIAVLAAATLAAVSVDAQQARGRGAAWTEIQGFNIVLVVGESQSSGGSSDTLPSSAKRALNDMREFLPYKHYRVLDSQWMSCCSSETLRNGLPISGRLQGVAGGTGSGGATVLLPRGYVYNLTVSGLSESARMAVKFMLRLDEPSSRSAQSSAARAREIDIANLRSELETLTVQSEALKRRVEVGTANADELKLMRLRQEQLQRQLATMDGYGSGSSSRSFMESSFMMEPGETVVVGTSRLGGDKALIALVTAVRRSLSVR